MSQRSLLYSYFFALISIFSLNSTKKYRPNEKILSKSNLITRNNADGRCVDFSNFPTTLQTIILEDQTINPNARFSNTERSDFLAADQSTRVASLITKDPTMKKFIQIITMHQMNECAKAIFDPNGTSTYIFYIIDEGLVDYDPNNPSSSNISIQPILNSAFASCNNDILKLFLGLSTTDTLSSTHLTYQTSIYDAINNETVVGERIQDRVSMRVIHPI